MDLSDLGWLIPGVAGFKAAEASHEVIERGNELNAYNTYMATIPANNNSAQNLKTEWNVWFSSLSWYDKNLNDIIYREARNRVGLFELANAPNSDAREAIKKRLIEQGLKEIALAAAKGEAIPLDVKTGLFLEPESDVLTTKGKLIVAGVSLVGTIGLLGFIALKIKKSIL